MQLWRARQKRHTENPSTFQQLLPQWSTRSTRGACGTRGFPSPNPAAPPVTAGKARPTPGAAPRSRPSPPSELRAAHTSCLGPSSSPQAPGLRGEGKARGRRRVGPGQGEGGGGAAPGPSPAPTNLAHSPGRAARWRAAAARGAPRAGCPGRRAAEARPGAGSCCCCRGPAPRRPPPCRGRADTTAQRAGPALRQWESGPGKHRPMGGRVVGTFEGRGRGRAEGPGGQRGGEIGVASPGGKSARNRRGPGLVWGWGRPQRARTGAGRCGECGTGAAEGTPRLSRGCPRCR